MSGKKGNQRHELIRQKFSELYSQAKSSPYADVNLSRIYQAVSEELCYSPSHVRNVIKNYY